MSSWNRTYRPRSIAALHLDSVRKQFELLMKSGKMPQVFIFAGPKGTGKTSTSRILGALLNTPQNKNQVKAAFFDKKSNNQPFIDGAPQDAFFESIFEGNSYTVQEMDAASNRGIDDVRSLKERVALPPAQGSIAVYILDEAHMLTTEAFNALLKLLEEPPSHAVFILATTELHKIPETIVSRAHAVTFQKASTAEITAALENILVAEKIEYEPKALEIIAKRADGSFRDAVKLAEFISSTGAITEKTVAASISSSTETLLPTLIQAVLSKDIKEVVKIFNTLRSENTQEVFFHKSLLAQLHQALMQGYGLEKGTSTVPVEAARFLLTELSDGALSQPSPLPLLALEMKLLDIITRAQKKAAAPNSPPSTPTGGAQQPRPAAAPVRAATPEVKKAEVQKDIVPTAFVSTPAVSVVSSAGAADGAELCDRWIEFVESVAKKNATVAALLRSAQPVEGGLGTATIRVYYKFHQEQLATSRFNILIQECAETLLGGTVQFTYVVAEPIVATAELQDVTNMSDLSELTKQALL